MTITYRNTKGTALTYDEMDENIRDLRQDTTLDRVLGNGNTTTKNISVGSINATAISINNQSAFSSPPAIGDITPNTITGTSVADTKGEIRLVPINVKASTYTLQLSDHGKFISTASGVTVPASIFLAGQSITIFNNSTSNITITQDTNVTLYLVGTNTTGNRTLAQYGLATVFCVSTNIFVITGGGLS
jgi:hypothetical protein